MKFKLEESRRFLRDVFSEDYILESCVDWIGSYLEPEQVFGKEQLETWALDNGFEIKEQ